MILTLLPPRAIAGPAESWFAMETMMRSQAGGQPLAATPVMRSGQLLIRVVQIQTPGETQRAVFYSYAAAGGQQMVVLIIPEMVVDSDLRVQIADRYVQGLAARRIDLGWVLASVSPGPQFVSPGIAPSASPADQLQRSYDQAESLQRFQNNMTTLTIDQMHAMSPH